jgi:ethanolamine utilization protein EutP (predicted NTPase)
MTLPTPKRKLLICTEGYTETTLVSKLLTELISSNKTLTIKHQRLSGKDSKLEVRHVNRIGTKAAELHITIRECCNDARVLSQIKNNYHQWVTSGHFCQVLGVKDIGIRTPADIARVSHAQKAQIAKWPLAALVLAIIETEAWFLAEETHYAKIHAALTPASIATLLPPQPFHHISYPAKELDRIYRTQGQQYLDAGGEKRKAFIDSTITALDMTVFVMMVAPQFPELEQLIQHLTNFLTT